MPKRPRGGEVVAGSSRDNNPIRSETVPATPVRDTEWRDLCQSLQESSLADISRLRELYEEVMKVRAETPKVDATPQEMCEVLATFYLTERSVESTSPYFSGGAPSIPIVLAHNFKLLVLKGDARNLLKLCQTNRAFSQLCNKEVDWEAVYKALGSAVGVDRIHVPPDFNFRGAVQRLAKLQEEFEKYSMRTPTYDWEPSKPNLMVRFFLNSLAPTLADMHTDVGNPYVFEDPIRRAVNGGYKYIYETAKSLGFRRIYFSQSGVNDYIWKAIGMWEDNVRDMLALAFKNRFSGDTRGKGISEIYLEAALMVVEGMLVSNKGHLVSEFLRSVTLIENDPVIGDVPLTFPQDIDVLREWATFLGMEMVRRFLDQLG